MRIDTRAQSLPHLVYACLRTPALKHTLIAPKTTPAHTSAVVVIVSPRKIAGQMSAASGSRRLICPMRAMPPAARPRYQSIAAKNMLTTPYVFCAEDAEAMAKAGADIIVCHLGLTTGGSIGAETALTIADCPALVDSWAEAALKVNKDAIILVHGGPVAMPEDAEYVLKNTSICHGFYGASSMERLPTEVALTEQTRAFKRIAGK